MALFTAALTLTGGSDKVTTIIGAALTGATKKGIRMAIFQNTTGNGAVTVGKADVSTITGFTIADGAVWTLGPFSGNASVNLDEIYLKGTGAKVLNLLLITP